MWELRIRRDWDGGLWVLMIAGTALCLGSMILRAVMSALAGLQ